MEGEGAGVRADGYGDGRFEEGAGRSGRGC